MADEILRMDVDGYDVLTTALVDLVNEFPHAQEQIRFNVLKDSGGIGFYPLQGAVIEREQKDVLGNTTQTCVYPFAIVYRSNGMNEARRKNVKEWLDDLGRWLEGQDIDGIVEYPALTNGRKIKEVRRQSPAYQMNINADGSEDWSISISARYINEF